MEKLVDLIFGFATSSYMIDKLFPFCLVTFLIFLSIFLAFFTSKIIYDYVKNKYKI